MIFYIASYPRSGNSWVRHLIANHFERFSTTVHGKNSSEELLNWFLIKSLGSESFEVYHVLLTPTDKNLDPDFFYYHPIHDQTVLYRNPVPGCKIILDDPKRRAELAGSSELFFLKTHDLPFETYLPGEYVIQPIRNAGACCWSYFHFFQDVRGKEVPLEDVLLGKVHYGHWSTYQKEWQKAGETLADHYLPLYYEEMFDELNVCKKLESFTGLPMLNDDFKPFAYYHHKMPNHARKGQVQGWEKNYSTEQLELLWREHGEMMSYHSYANPLEEKLQPRNFDLKEKKKNPPPPVFITARFRTGSTMLWNMFRQLQATTSFYEPLHEELIQFINEGIEPQPEHFHVDSYFDEYAWLDDVLKFHNAGFGTSHLHLEKEESRPALRAYVTALLHAAREDKTPVLKFNRIDFRLEWMRANFPQARILHLYRSPRAQWYSSLVRFPEDVDTHLNADPYRITTWSRDLCGIFPFLASPYLEHLYQRFYYLWKLSYLAGTRLADWSVSYEDILADPNAMIPKILGFAGLDTPENQAKALTVIKATPQRLWKQDKSDEWFDAQERHCEDLLSELGLNQNFGLMPIEEIIQASTVYNDMVQDPQNKTWAMESSKEVLVQQQNDLNAKEKIIQKMNQDIQDKAKQVEILTNSVLSYHTILQGYSPENVEDLRDRLKAKEDEVRRLADELMNTRAILTAQKEQIGQSDIALKLQNELSAKESFIQNRTKQILDMQSRLQIAQNALSEIEEGRTSFEIIEGLHEELTAKEEVIQELIRFRRSSVSYWLRGILFPALYRFSPTRAAGRWVKSLRRKFMPRLFVLEQHQHRPLKLPKRYCQLVKLPVNNIPTISIVTPSYNQVEFLERTLKSVLDQQYPNLEYIVQDGASTDGTTSILEQYRSRLAVVNSHSDEGQAQAINLGFSHSRGEIMAYLNSDDVLLPGALAYVARYFNENPEIDVIYSHRIIIDEQDQEVGRWILPPHDPIALQYADYIPQETLFWRRRIWEKTGGKIDEQFHFALDWDLLLRFQEAGAEFARVPRPLAAFRIHPAQKTAAQMKNVGEKEMRLLRDRCAGYPVNLEEINEYMCPYLRRSVRYHYFFNSGLLD